MRIRDPLSYIYVTSNASRDITFTNLYHWVYDPGNMCTVSPMMVVVHSTTNGATLDMWACDACGVTYYIACCTCTGVDAYCRINTSLPEEFTIDTSSVASVEASGVVDEVCWRDEVGVTVIISLSVGCVGVVMSVIGYVVRIRRCVAHRRT
jgi:hypothetical protein